MIRTIFFSVILLIAAGCAAPKISAPVAEPAVNFPTVSPDLLAVCNPEDLSYSSNFSGGADEVILGATLTNKSKQPCVLPNPPKIGLLDSTGKQIELKAFEQAPAQTPPSPKLMVISPNESAIISLLWRNYCYNLPSPTVSIRVEFPNGQKQDIKIKIQAPPGCSANNEPSTIIIAPYSYPP